MSFKNWSEYTEKEKAVIRKEAKTRGVSEIYILAERDTLYSIEYAKELAMAELRLVRAELEV